jgi:hypothetical protein
MKLWKIVGLMICLSILVAVPVSAAETYQDDITGTGALTSDYYDSVSETANCPMNNLIVYNANLVDTATVLIQFDKPGGATAVYAAGAFAGDTTWFEAKKGAALVGTGTLGYQRLYDGAGVEQPGYQYLQFATWDNSGLAGTETLDITHGAYNLTTYLCGATGAGWTIAPPASGAISFSSGGSRGSGLTMFRRQFAFTNSYSATKPAGLGIVGTVWKSALAGGTFYSSRAYVINATDNQIVTSQGALSLDSLHFDIQTESIYIATVDINGDFHNSTTLFTVTPEVAGTYSISVLPATLTLPGTVQGSILGSSADLAKITDIDWSWTDATGTYDFNEAGNTSRPLSYTNVSGTWWGYELGAGGVGGQYSRNKGATFPNPVTLSNVSSSGYKLVTCFIGTSDGYWYTLTDDLMVDQGGMQTLVIEATDAYSNALVSYADISVLDKSTNLWSNITASGGVFNYLFPYNSNLYIEGIANGYGRTTKNWTVLPYPSYILKLPMYPTGTIAATNVTLNVVVLDGSTSGVFPNAQVRLSDGQVKSTSGAGVATFTVLAAKSYQIIASYTGYSSATRTLTTGTGGTSQDTYLTLNRIVVTTAPTLPPGVTAVVTLDTRTNAQKDLDMMNQIREYAPMLITLAMLMTMMYLVGYKP